MIYTTVIRLSKALAGKDIDNVEARVGLHDDTTSITVESEQVTVDIEASSNADADDIADSILNAVREIDPDAELELVTRNPSDQEEDDDDDKDEDSSDEDEDEDEDWDDFEEDEDDDADDEGDSDY